MINIKRIKKIMIKYYLILVIMIKIKVVINFAIVLINY